jgi:hypothetical protein
MLRRDKMTDAELVKNILGEPEIGDAIVSFYLDTAADIIKNYCNIATVPKELHTTHIRIAAYLIKANTSAGKANLNGGLVSVSSISDGNQSIGYNSGNRSVSTDDEIIAVFGPALDRFKVMQVHRPQQSLRRA